MDLPNGITLIAAVGKSGQLGLGNQLPWAFDRKDMQWFRQVTMEANACIAGHNTMVSLPTLPNRILLTDITSVTPTQFLQLYNLTFNDKVVVIGGAKTYARWMDIARTVLITKIDYKGPADTWMPNIWRS